MTEFVACMNTCLMKLENYSHEQCLDPGADYRLQEELERTFAFSDSWQWEHQDSYVQIECTSWYPGSESTQPKMRSLD